MILTVKDPVRPIFLVVGEDTDNDDKVHSYAGRDTNSNKFTHSIWGLGLSKIKLDNDSNSVSQIKSNGNIPRLKAIPQALIFLNHIKNR
jgi:hypothetical protein